MNILITGASGFVGSELLKSLNNPQYNLTCISRKSQQKINKEVWLKGDLADLSFVRHAVKNQDVIIHLANDLLPLDDSNPLADLRSSLKPTLNILEALRHSCKKPHIIFLSSGGSIYGEVQVQNQPIVETHKCEPVSSYGISKLTAERFFEQAAVSNKIKCTILRVSNIYGDYLNPDANQGIIGVTMERCRQGKSLRLIGSKTNIRDFIHINDVVSAIKLALHMNKEFNIFNIGSGKGTSIIELLTMISELFGNELSYIEEESISTDYLPKVNILDTSKAREELGWDAKISLQAGLAMMLNK